MNKKSICPFKHADFWHFYIHVFTWNNCLFSVNFGRLNLIFCNVCSYSILSICVFVNVVILDIHNSLDNLQKAFLLPNSCIYDSFFFKFSASISFTWNKSDNFHIIFCNICSYSIFFNVLLISWTSFFINFVILDKEKLHFWKLYFWECFSKKIKFQIKPLEMYVLELSRRK